MNLFRITFPVGMSGRRRTSSGCSANIEKGIDNGFVFSLFGNNSPVYTIFPEKDSFTDEELLQWCAENETGAPPFPGRSITRDEHTRLVERAIDFVKDMEEKNPPKSSKVIAARVSIANVGKSLPEIYAGLENAYPDACVFLFSSPVSGTWIGASPELLFYIEEGMPMVDTVALAGTRPAGTEGEWDEKNILEQRMVTDFIVESLGNLGLRPSAGEPYTRRAGNIEHICSFITAHLGPYYRKDLRGVSETIASALSPTPALCGTPRDEAQAFIEAEEGFDRLCYGGYVGLVGQDEAWIYVNLRSGRIDISNGKIALYAGGGITRDSVPETEWTETERKLTTMLSHL